MIRVSLLLFCLAASLAGAEQAADRSSDITTQMQIIREYETALPRLQYNLERWAEEEQAAQAQFATVRPGLGDMLRGARIAGFEIPGAHPKGPVARVQAARLLRVLQSDVGASATEVRHRALALSAARQTAEDVAAELSDTRVGLQAAREALTEIIAARSDVPLRFLADPAQMEALLNAAETLDSFTEWLGTAPGPADTPDVALLKGRLPWPVEGRVVAEFAPLRGRFGLYFVPSSALVTAPLAATIRYAGPLLDLGNVVVLEPEAGTHIVLAHLDTVFGEPGQIVERGDPVGLTRFGGPNDAAAPLRAEVSGAPDVDTLYIEVRIQQSPEDPADWFVEDKDG